MTERGEKTRLDENTSNDSGFQVQDMVRTKPKILIVDDRVENLIALRQVLRDVDAEVVQATSGNQALAATLDHDFALAILDVYMPAMDGYELAGLLRGDPKTSRLPIIFLTAVYGEEEHIFKGYAAGGVDYIVKPYNPSVLLSKTNVFLTLYRQNTALLGKVVELRQHRERLEELVMARTVNLKRQQAELKAANQELEAFAYSVSHDLRSPLRGVDGYSRLLLEGYADQLDDDGRFMLTQVRESAQEMGRLIDDLLTFSRLGRCGMKMQYCDMTTIVQDLFREMEQGHPARCLRLELKALSSCSGDSGMIREVVRNLLDNAVKFTGTRDEAVIEVGMWNGEQKTGLIPDLPGGDQPLVVYYVKDNGVGFDTRYRDKLFQVFQRLHRSEDFEGTGIGLALVRRILQRHGGEICADSEPDNGATFYFSLPDIQMEGLGDG